MILNGPKPGRRAGILSDRLHLGNCVRCRCGIYVGDPNHRGRGPWLGLLCHDCAVHLGYAGAAR